MASRAGTAGRISPEEFLAIDRAAEFKSEYYDGEIVAMSGASLAHNRMVRNLIVALGSQLRGGPSEVLASAMRVWNPVRRSFTFPDVVVVCGEPLLSDGQGDVLLNPTLLIEVLSASTETKDRGEKAEGFRRLESLQEYLLVAQGELRVERYRRSGERQWVLTEALDLEDELDLDSVGCTLALRDVYENVFDAPSKGRTQTEAEHG